MVNVEKNIGYISHWGIKLSAQRSRLSRSTSWLRVTWNPINSVVCTSFYKYRGGRDYWSVVQHSRLPARYCWAKERERGSLMVHQLFFLSTVSQGLLDGYVVFSISRVYIFTLTCKGPSRVVWVCVRALIIQINHVFLLSCCL